MEVIQHFVRNDDHDELYIMEEIIKKINKSLYDLN